MKTTRPTSTPKKAYKKVKYNPVNPPIRRLYPEKKNVDTDNAATIIFATGTAALFLLNGIGQGATEVQHVGRTVMMKSIAWKWTGSLAATTTGATALRLLIIYDKQANGVAPTAIQILNTDSIESMMLLNNNKRFVILVDHEIPCLGTQGPQAWFEKGYRKLNLPIEFGGAGATVAAIDTGSVYALCYSQGTLGVASPVSQLATRIRFTDM